MPLPPQLLLLLLMLVLLVLLVLLILLTLLQGGTPGRMAAWRWGYQRWVVGDWQPGKSFVPIYLLYPIFSHLSLSIL